MTWPLGDNPIRSGADDALERDAAARNFVEQLLAVDRMEGLVAGITGPWGSGKTSFINLARPHLENAGVVLLDFNPWMFSGADQLVDSFFVELSSQLKLRTGMDELGGLIADYGEAFSGLGWLPLVGPWIERGRGAARILSKILQRRKEGVSDRRNKLRDALRASDKTIAVVLDDIDRLTSSEIRDIFKLVRLTASFPNVVYLVAFDRLRVEAALAEQGVPGRDYLEKILQLSVDLPAVPNETLRTQTTRALDSVLSNVEWIDEADRAAWPDVLAEIILPLIRNMRDVRRYAIAVKGATLALGGQIALTDLLALEAIRVFLPDVFSALHRFGGALTGIASLPYGSPEVENRARIDELLKLGATHEQVVRALVIRIFPAAQGHIGGSHYGSGWEDTWRRGRRVAHKDHLLLYMERTAGASLTAFNRAEDAWNLMSDATAFEASLRSVPPVALENTIASLETFENDFGKMHAIPGVSVLLNLLPDIPERALSMFDADKRIVVRRLVFRLIKVFDDESEAEAAVTAILPRLRSLSSTWHLISLVGHRESEGHGLVSAEFAERIEREWLGHVREATADSLAREEDLLRVLLVAASMEAAPNASILPDSAVFDAALLRAARSQSRSQLVGNRAVERVDTLAWDSLIDLVGGEDELLRRVESARGSQGGDPELFALFDKYAAGWRPDHLG